MATRLVSFHGREDGAPTHTGVLIDDDYLIQLVTTATPLSIASDPRALEEVREWLGAEGVSRERLPLKDVRLTAPVDPFRIFAIGRNYVEHAKEGGGEVPDYPMIFFKPNSSVVGPGDDIIAWPTTQKIDWEGELTAVVGKRGRDIPVENALEYVAGYTIANDVTARDWQRRTSQFDAGKMFDTFCPLGPCLVPADEVDPQNLDLETTVNGVLMQSGTTRDMVFTVAHLVSYISQAVEIRPGDIILTGTPAGVGYAREVPIFLHPGDEVCVSISEIGLLVNSVANPADVVDESYVTHDQVSA